MPQLVDRTLCLLYRVLPAAHSQEERQTADAFALWAGEWIDLMVKGWLRRQIDEEQTLALPSANLAPGKRIRLQIRQALSGELKTVEITLPPDFAVGKPIRLRGLGKRVGPWQGDLYLIITNE